MVFDGPPVAPMEMMAYSLLTTPTLPLKIRTKFPETWVFAFITSAFAINDNSGLGVAPTTAKLRVFRPFFIRLNLPYSVKRGEKFALLVLIFNYMDKEQDRFVCIQNLIIRRLMIKLSKLI
uniref:A2M domain-containing protein n=1 Tax=Heterorhabditis bacteriophora TaxID=37862 RepID=A0A1I7WRZ9_HETBA